MLIELNEFFYEGESHTKHLLTFGEVKLFLEEGVVDVEKVNLLWASHKLLISQLGWIDQFIFLEDIAVVANIASIEDIPQVSLKQHQHRSETVIGIEKSDRDLQASRHL